MRILLVNDYIEKIGGVEVYCYLIKELLEQRGHQVVYIGGKKRNVACSLISSIFSISYYKKIQKEILNFKPDIIHAHSFSENISPSFLLAANKYRIPVVVTPPNHFHYAYILPPLNEFYKLVRWPRVYLHSKFAKKYVSLFISPSKLFATHLNNLGIRKIAIVPHPAPFVNNVCFNSKPKNSKIILYVGRLVKEKGVEYLIKALPLILKSVPDVCLYVVGEGSQKKSLERLAFDLNVIDNVQFIAYTPHEYLTDLYSNSTIFVLPSICQELYPLTILEAMHYGLPVITTKLGGQQEMVKDGINGYCVLPKNEIDLAEKIVRVLNAPSYTAYLSQNAFYYSNYFLPEPHVETLEKYYMMLQNNYLATP